MILITGVGGFAGRHLAALCAERGVEVVGLGRRERPDISALSAYERVDLADRSAVREVFARVKPERVFHLAAEASVPRSWEAPADVVTANVSGSLNLLEALRLEAPRAAVLVACSSQEYGTPERLPVDERHPLNPGNPYAASKAMVDLLAASYVQSHDMQIVRMRAFNHAGPGQSQSFVVSSFARQIAEAECAGEDRVVVATGAVGTRRDFSDVRDVVRAYWLALERGESEVFNVCSGRAIAVSDILTGLASHTRLEVSQRTDPSRLRDKEVTEIRGSHDRLTDATGWRPEIDFSDTLEDTLEWWRERVRTEVGSR